MSFNCQRSFGPSLGHCLSSPVSGETPVRPGPFHCGQSAFAALRLLHLEVATGDTQKHRATIEVSNLNFKGISFSVLRINFPLVLSLINLRAKPNFVLDKKDTMRFVLCSLGGRLVLVVPKSGVQFQQLM